MLNFINVFLLIHRYFTHFCSTWPGKFWENRKTLPPLLLPSREYLVPLYKLTWVWYRINFASRLIGDEVKMYLKFPDCKDTCALKKEKACDKNTCEILNKISYLGQVKIIKWFWSLHAPDLPSTLHFFLLIQLSLNCKQQQNVQRDPSTPLFAFSIYTLSTFPVFT